MYSEEKYNNKSMQLNVPIGQMLFHLKKNRIYINNVLMMYSYSNDSLAMSKLFSCRIGILGSYIISF